MTLKFVSIILYSYNCRKLELILCKEKCVKNGLKIALVFVNICIYQIQELFLLFLYFTKEYICKNHF